MATTKRKTSKGEKPAGPKPQVVVTHKKMSEIFGLSAVGDCFGNRIWIVQRSHETEWHNVAWVKPEAYGIKKDALEKAKNLRDELIKQGRDKEYMRKYGRHRVVELGLATK